MIPLVFAARTCILLRFRPFTSSLSFFFIIDHLLVQVAWTNELKSSGKEHRRHLKSECHYWTNPNGTTATASHFLSRQLSFFTLPHWKDVARHFRSELTPHAFLLTSSLPCSARVLPVDSQHDGFQVPRASNLGGCSCWIVCRLIEPLGSDTAGLPRWNLGLQDFKLCATKLSASISNKSREPTFGWSLAHSPPPAATSLRGRPTASK
jgi:hypothetical protein